MLHIVADAVFGPVNFVFIISVRAAHCCPDTRKWKRGAWKGRVVLVNSLKKAMLGCPREGCQDVCAFCAKGMLSVCFCVELQMADYDYDVMTD